MTAIVAISYEGGALMAGDAAGCAGDLIIREHSPKVARRKGYLIGAAGDASACMVALHGCDVAYSGGGLAWWAHTSLAPQLRQLLPAQKCSDDDEVPSCTLLLAAPGELVVLDGTGGAVDVVDDYAAVGCGAHVAVGALMTARRLSPMRRARAALRAATRHVTGVSAPWSYVRTDGAAGAL